MSVRRAYVTESALGRLTRAAERAAPYESGGILAGVLTRDRVWITSVIEVRTRDVRRSRFRIPRGVTHPAIEALRTNDDRVGYIGDWHSHPADVGPSQTDRSTLRSIASGVFVRRRLLGLVRDTTEGWRLELWACEGLRRWTNVPYELTGPLPE